MLDGKCAWLEKQVQESKWDDLMLLMWERPAEIILLLERQSFCLHQPYRSITISSFHQEDVISDDNGRGSRI